VAHIFNIYELNHFFIELQYLRISAIVPPEALKENEFERGLGGFF